MLFAISSLEMWIYIFLGLALLGFMMKQFFKGFLIGLGIWAKYLR